MNEKARTHESAHEQTEVAETHETHIKKPEVDHAALEKQQDQLLETSRDSAEQQATPSSLLAIEKDETRIALDVSSHNSIKRESYKSLLKTTQQSLPAITRQFSKLIHEKHIETISNISSQTVARPSGLLGGGLGALAGSITLLYYSKYYGFRYNYAFFFVTFIAGFAVGLLIELLLKLFKRR